VEPRPGFNTTGEITGVLGYARFSQTGWGHKGDILVITVDQMMHLIGDARHGGSGISDPVDWHSAPSGRPEDLKGVLITQDDLRELTRLAGKKEKSFLEENLFSGSTALLDIAGEVVGSFFGVPIPIGTVITGISDFAAHPDLQGALALAEKIAPAVFGATGFDVPGMASTLDSSGLTGLPPGLNNVTGQGLTNIDSSGGGGPMGLLDSILSGVGIVTGGYDLGGAIGDVFQEVTGMNTPPYVPPSNSRGAGASDTKLILEAGPGTGGTTMSGTLADATLLTGAGRLPRSIPLSALVGSNGMVMIPQGYHAKSLRARRPQAGRAAGSYAVRNRSINYLNLHALRKASHRLEGATRIVKHLFSLPHHTIRAKHRKKRAFAGARK
jgi:hypothetical protein